MLCWSLLIVLSLGGEPVAPDDVVTTAVAAEIDRTLEAWQGQEDPPYFLSTRVTETRSWSIRGEYGALSYSRADHGRRADVAVRVGDRHRDSTHALRERWDRRHRSDSGRLIVEDVPEVLQHQVWALTDRAIRKARERIVKVRGEAVVLVEETDPSDDFAPVAAHLWSDELPRIRPDVAELEDMVRELSGILHAGTWTEYSNAAIDIVDQTKWVVTSEGTRIRQPRRWIRLSMNAEASAEDGMDVDLYRWLDVDDLADLPPRAELERWAASLSTDLRDLLEAPVGAPYSGPVLLRGRAAGVFVHEVIGHRVEGHRQKEEDEGRTFRELVGERILPTSISIFDDPTLQTWAGFDLNGHYRFDEEGMPGQRASIVDAGVFRGFLMSRSPIRGFDDSNGHGRAQVGRHPVARMANTIVSTTDPKPEAELRRLLVAEVRRQGLPYGVIVDELAGGFTMTGRVQPNAFNVRASTSWRIYADGRPDELVRGIDLVGTPLTALQAVVAAGDDPGVFNGFCGAESGSVPNAAVSPSLLLSRLEMQLEEKEQARPPLIARPDLPGGDT